MVVVVCMVSCILQPPFLFSVRIGFVLIFFMRLLFVCFLFGAIQCFGQQRVFHTSNLHAHNDYVKPLPFYDAFNKGFGSIEADIFLKEGKLLVAHSAAELDEKRTLETMYL